MVLIEEIIGTSNFEFIRDSIGSILLTELENQKILQGFDEDIKIFCERTHPVQNSELLTINLSLESGDFSGKTQSSSMGKIIYNIDVYTTGAANEAQTGGEDSSFRLHKFIGMIRFILSHTAYRTLNMPLGIVGGSNIESFIIGDPNVREDSSYIKMARIQFSVNSIESQSLEKGVDFYENATMVKLHETELGYIYKINN